MNNDLSPIVLFVYDRKDHTQKTIEALKNNKLAKESNLYIYADGSKNDMAKVKVEKVRKYIRQVTGFKSVNIIEREMNMGLAHSVIEGVTEVVNQYGKVIVLEDDIVCSEIFLEYMNNALNYYQDKKQVFSITGYNMAAHCDKIERDTFFINFADCWSWATWADRWQHFDSLAKGWEELKHNAKKRKAFNLDNAFPYFDMLKDQMEGNINSWAIRWQWSVFKQNGLILIPKYSIVKNIGLDNSGIHCGKQELKSNEIYEFKSLELESNIMESKKNRKLFTRNIRKENNSLFIRSKKVFCRLLKVKRLV